MKKHLKLIIGLSIAGVIILGAAAAFIFAKDVIINRIMLIIKSDVGYFQWVADREVDAACTKIENSEALREASSGMFPAEGRGTLKASLRTHTSEAFTDMLKVLPIKDMGLDTDIAFTDGSASISLRPAYNGNTLLTLNALYDMDKGVLQAELPEYKEGVVDFSSLLGMTVSEDKTAGELISEWVGKLRESMPDTSNIDPADLSEKYRRYADVLIESIGDVELMTGSTISINKESVKCTEIRISVKGEEMKDQLDSITSLIFEDYADEIRKFEEKSGQTIKREDIVKLFDSVAKDISGKLILYVDNKADLLAVDVRFDYKATKLGAKIRWNDTETGYEGKISFSLNQINAVDINFERINENDAGEKVFKLNIVPDSFIDTFLGEYSGLGLEIIHSGKKYSDTFTLRLNKQGRELASLVQEIKTEDFSSHTVNAASKQIYPIADIGSSGYLSISGIAGFAIGVLDRIGEPELEKRIDDNILTKTFGEGFTIDAIREMIDNGTIDILDSVFGILFTGQAGNLSLAELGQKALNPNPYNLNDYGFPDTRIEPVLKYPKDGETYTYSKIAFADYALPGRYRARVFKMPEPEEVTPEAFENEKKSFLDGYEKKILVDQANAVVEWDDEVYLDILPYLYGIAIEAYHYKNSYARIGQEMYGEGLDEQILGMKVGEAKEITTTLGSQYGTFAGVEATFKVTVTKIDRYVKPEWTEEFICGSLGYGSLDDCSDMLMKRLVVEKDVSDEEIREKLVKEAKAETVYTDIPEELYYEALNRYYNEVYDMTEQQGKTPLEYFAEQGINATALYSMLESDFKNNIRDYCFYAAVARNENISLTGREVNELIDRYKAEYQCDDYTELMKKISFERIIDTEIEARIGEVVLESAVIEPHD